MWTCEAGFQKIDSEYVKITSNASQIYLSIILCN